MGLLYFCYARTQTRTNPNKRITILWNEHAFHLKVSLQIINVIGLEWFYQMKLLSPDRVRGASGAYVNRLDGFCQSEFNG